MLTLLLLPNSATLDVSDDGILRSFLATRFSGDVDVDLDAGAAVAAVETTMPGAALVGVPVGALPAVGPVAAAADKRAEFDDDDDPEEIELPSSRSARLRLRLGY